MKACVVMAYIVMTYIVMAYIVMACIGMVYTTPGVGMMLRQPRHQLARLGTRQHILPVTMAPCNQCARSSHSWRGVRVHANAAGLVSWLVT